MDGACRSVAIIESNTNHARGGRGIGRDSAEREVSREGLSRCGSRVRVEADRQGNGIRAAGDGADEDSSKRDVRTAHADLARSGPLMANLQTVGHFLGRVQIDHHRTGVEVVRVHVGHGHIDIEQDRGSQAGLSDRRVEPENRRLLVHTHRHDVDRLVDRTDRALPVVETDADHALRPGRGFGDIAVRQVSCEGLGGGGSGVGVERDHEIGRIKPTGTRPNDRPAKRHVRTADTDLARSRPLVPNLQSVGHFEGRVEEDTHRTGVEVGRVHVGHGHVGVEQDRGVPFGEGDRRIKPEDRCLKAVHDRDRARSRGAEYESRGRTADRQRGKLFPFHHTIVDDGEGDAAGRGPVENRDRAVGEGVVPRREVRARDSQGDRLIPGDGRVGGRSHCHDGCSRFAPG